MLSTNPPFAMLHAADTFISQTTIASGPLQLSYTGTKHINMSPTFDYSSFTRFGHRWRCEISQFDHHRAPFSLTHPTASVRRKHHRHSHHILARATAMANTVNPKMMTHRCRAQLRHHVQRFPLLLILPLVLHARYVLEIQILASCGSTSEPPAIRSL